MMGSLADDRTRLAHELLMMADDEFVLGAFLAEMTGGGPFVEENVALSSIAQDELGHAELLYNVVPRLQPYVSWKNADAFVYERPVEEFRNAALVESGSHAWENVVVRHYLYEMADDFRIKKLLEAAEGEVKELLLQIQREEQFHLYHWKTWMSRLALHDEGKRRLQEQLVKIWSKFTGFFMDTEWSEHRGYILVVERELNAMGFDIPAVPEKDSGRTEHSEELVDLLMRNRTIRLSGVGTQW